MATSKEILIPIAPVPAARPRVSKYGTYYPKKYADYRRTLLAYLERVLPEDWEPFEGPVRVEVEFICAKPLKPSNPYPQGDIDNYEKGIFDVLTHNGRLWKDDVQIVKLRSRKRYCQHPEEPRIEILIEEDR